MKDALDQAEARVAAAKLDILLAYAEVERARLERESTQDSLAQAQNELTHAIRERDRLRDN